LTWINTISAAAKASGIPSVIVSNFTFDQVYLGLLSKENDALDQKLRNLIEIVIADYTCANLLLRLPGAIRIPSFDDAPQLVPGENQVCIINGRSQIPFIERAPIQTPESIVERRIIDIPLVYRKAVRTRQQVLHDLGIPNITHKILLLSFGGHLYDTSRWDPNAILPNGWICIVSGMSDSIELPDRFYRASRDDYVPDLTNASDVVLGKLGYGTCSECVGHQTPFIYVPRPQFIEEYGLLKFMKDQGSVVKLEQTEFEDGRWKNAILEADLLSGTCDDVDKRISHDGGVVSAKIIDDYLEEWMETKKNKKKSNINRKCTDMFLLKNDTIN
jgi:L-arabinokinase